VLLKSAEARLIVKTYPDCKDKREAVTRWEKSLGHADVQENEIALDAKKLIQHMTFVIENSYATFGGNIYKLTVGIPTGTNMSPEVTNIYLLWYEMTYFQRQIQHWNSLSKGQQLFMLTFKRYIDDLFKMQSFGFDFKAIMYFEEDKDGIYPKVLTDTDGRQIKDPLELEGEMGDQCDFLDSTVSIDGLNNRTTWTLFDKRRAMKVDETPMSQLRNFPHWDTMLSKSCKLGVITSQMFRFNRRCFKARDFIKETVTYCQKLIKEGYDSKEVLNRVVHYRHWDPRRGKWPIIWRELKKRLTKFINARKLTK